MFALTNPYLYVYANAEPVKICRKNRMICVWDIFDLNRFLYVTAHRSVLFSMAERFARC
jgi:hypothetical protein